MRNLVANAIDHGEGRPVEITLAADDRAVAVLVRDHGVGLRPGEAGLVFNRFWRAEASRARRSGGSGLGLSIAVEDARLHGGWLQAWGETGEGAAFRLTLPRTTGDTIESSPLPLGPEDGSPAAADAGSAEPGGSVPTPPPAWPVLTSPLRNVPVADVDTPHDTPHDPAHNGGPAGPDAGQDPAAQGIGWSSSEGAR